MRVLVTGGTGTVGRRTGVESEALLDLFFPDVTARKRTLHGAESLVSIERARELIGFEPEHSRTD